MVCIVYFHVSSLKHAKGLTVRLIYMPGHCGISGLLLKVLINRLEQCLDQPLNIFIHKLTKSQQTHGI